jgi:hypothetical protein
VSSDGFGDLPAHREHGIERRHWLLEDHGDPVAPNASQSAEGHREEILALEQISPQPFYQVRG